MGSHLLVILISSTIFISGSVMGQIIDPEVMAGESPQTVMISFEAGHERIPEIIDQGSYSTLAERRSALRSAQMAYSTTSQEPLRRYLQSIGVVFESFWINNRMIVWGASRDLIQVISQTRGVLRIQKEPVVWLPTLQAAAVKKGSRKGKFSGDMEGDGGGFQFQPPLLWHIKDIKVDKVWEQNYKGKGVVIASIDSGVHYTHEALIDGWREEYGWFDPYQKTATPNDQIGHGTHTMGTIAGRNGIGVAPESTWISCKGCNPEGCAISQLYSCGQWVLCPTKPDGTGEDCSYAPDIVSNSWAGNHGDWFDDIIGAWRAAKIIPVFSVGNYGPGCGTATYPSDHEDVIAVGSVDQFGRLSEFSSIGPSQEAPNKVKPDIVGPGEHILSAWNSSDQAYATYQGTSMACPQVSGVIGLMKGKKHNLSYDEAYAAIAGTAETKGRLVTSSGKTCGGTSPHRFPNHSFGYGLINALSSVNAVCQTLKWIVGQKLH